MIWKFFKEYAVWYLLYGILSVLYLLTFYLYHLPLSYFSASVGVNLTILVMLTIWQYLIFRRKLLILEHFLYVSELEELHLPSEKAYYDLIVQLKEKESAKQLATVSQQKDLQNLVKMWSHQMKVPLSALSLMAQTDHLEKKEVRQQLLRMEKYLDTLLTYLKFSDNKDDFRFELCSVRSIVTDLVKKYRISFLAKHLSVDMQGDWTVKSDKKWLSFAISQILDNAIKYSREGGQISIQLSPDGMCLSDTGIGILAEDLPRLFEEGFTGFNGHEHKKATGLGLYMTKQVLDKLELTIALDSQVDVGTTVTISKATPLQLSENEMP